MRVKRIVGKDDGMLLLNVKPGIREHIRRPELEWVETANNPLLARVRHDERGGTATALYYDFSRMRTLDELLSNGISANGLASILISTADLISTCILDSMDAGYLFLDVNWIYIDSDGYPRFAYVPIEWNQRNGRGAPKGHLSSLLMQISSNIAKRDLPQIRVWMDRMSEYASRSYEYITLKTYCSLLEQTLGLSLTKTTHEALHLINSRDSNYVESPNLSPRGEGLGGKGMWRGVSLHGSYNAFEREGGRQNYGGNGVGTTSEKITSGKVRTSAGDSFAGSAGNSVVSSGYEPSTALDPNSNRYGDVPTVKQGSQTGFVVVRMNGNDWYPIVGDGLIHMGRGSMNEVQLLGNPKISRNHAEISCVRGVITIQDLGSANGTWIGGRKLNPRVKERIGVGQRFSLANEDFEIKRGTD